MRVSAVLLLVGAATAPLPPSSASSSPLRIAAVGDSITAGICSSVTGGYPPLLQALLGEEYLVLNFGDGGKAMARPANCGCGHPTPGPDGPTSLNCSYWITPTYASALASSPDVVTIFLGTNDAKAYNWGNATFVGNYTWDYIKMVQAFKALPSSPKVYIVIPTPLYDEPGYDAPPCEMRQDITNTVFPTLLPSTILPASGADGVIDVFNALGGSGLSQPQQFCDGCHPVDQGYLEVAQTFFVFLQNEALRHGWPTPKPAPGLTRPENYACEECRRPWGTTTPVVAVH